MKDQIRAEFEQEFPLPNGVTFDGDHYVADPAVMGSFQNATIWSHMFRGWKRSRESLRIELPISFTDSNGYQALPCYETLIAIQGKGIRTC